MGICYTLILEDEWNWDYNSDRTKEDRLKEFEDKFGRYIEKIAQWDRYVVYDIDKAFPLIKERLELIREYADRAYYTDDLGSPITKLDLPSNKHSVQAYIDNIDSRRTPEEKKASEDIIRERLKKMEIT